MPVTDNNGTGGDVMPDDGSVGGTSWVDAIGGIASTVGGIINSVQPPPQGYTRDANGNLVPQTVTSGNILTIALLLVGGLVLYGLVKG